jgi:hypothetical protein
LQGRQRLDGDAERPCVTPAASDLVLLDSRRCYEFNFPVTANTLSLELPIAWVDSWITDAERCIGQRIDGRAGWGAALSAFACQLTPQLAIDRPLPARVLTDQLGALLALERFTV